MRQMHPHLAHAKRRLDSLNQDAGVQGKTWTLARANQIPNTTMSSVINDLAVR